jgi:DNA-binding response OmpR family regulator
MQIYVHEPREDRRTGLLTELRAGKILARPIEDGFFDCDLSLLNRPDSLGHAILLAAVSGVTDRITALRMAGCGNPVIVLRDFRNAAETAELLDRGADEVLVAPIKAIELKARVNAILRRSHGHASDAVKVGNIVAYFDGRDPEVAGTRTAPVAARACGLQATRAQRQQGCPEIGHLRRGLRDLGHAALREGHRRLHLQDPQEARRRDARRRALYRNGARARLPVLG